MRISLAEQGRGAAVGMLVAACVLLSVPGAALAAVGGISGGVTSASSHAAVANVQVDVYDSGQDFVTSTQTSASGIYTVSGLPAGTYEVGFVPLSGNFTSQFYSGKASLAAADPVSVTAGSTTPGIDAALATGGRITGTVTAASSHAAVGNVEVDVYDVSQNFIASTQTAADGTYTLSGLTTGSYEVGFVPASVILAPEFYSAKASLTTADPVSVTAGSTQSRIDAALMAAGQISGTVTDASSLAPLANVEVDVYDARGNFVNSTQSATNGFYSMSGLFPGSYEVGFVPTAGNYASQFYNGRSSLATATVVSVPAGSSRSGIDAALAAGAQIAGTVTDASSHAAVARVRVDIYDSSGTVITSTLTGSDGAYTVPGLAAGGYKVGFVPGGPYLAQFYNAQTSLATADPVSLTGGSTKSGVDAALRPPILTVSLAGAGSGFVTGAGISCPGTCSSSLANGTLVTLSASPAAGSAFAGWSGGGCSGTGPCTIALTADQAVTATFTALPILTVSLSGSGSGIVTGSGIACPSACSSSYPSGTSVTLTANPAAGSAFAGWSGGGCGAAAVCTVLLSSDQAVTADFAQSTAAAVPPSNHVMPSVGGTPRTGQKLTASTGSWSGSSPLSYSYQWRRCTSGCADIAGATASSYTLGPADTGDRILVVVTAGNAVGRASATSALVGPVAASLGQIKSSLSAGLVPSGKAARIGAILKAGGYRFSVKAWAAGQEKIGWYLVPAGAHLSKAKAPKPVLVATGTRSFTQAGPGNLRVRLTAAGRTALGRVKTIQLSAKASFTPSAGKSFPTSGGAAVSSIKRFRLRR